MTQRKNRFYKRESRMVLVLILFVISGDFLDANWSRFRGPDGSGVSDDTGLPTHFSPYQNVLWKAPLPSGHSSPVVSGHRIFVTAFESEKLLTVCLDSQTGKLLWRHEVTRRRVGEYHKMNNPATPSPVTDGKNVYVFFGDFGLICLGIDGRERWTLSLGPFNNPNGMGSSPILAGDQLLMLCDQDVGSFFLAVDKSTGKQKWRTERPEYTRGFSTPVLFRPQKQPLQVIVPGSVQLTAYDADTGKEVWWVRGLPWQMKSTPVLGRDNVYIHGVAGDGQWAEVSSFEETLKRLDANQDGKISKQEATDPVLQKWWSVMDLATDGSLDARDWEIFRERRVARNAVSCFRLGGQGDMTEASLVWRYDKAVPAVPSPLLYQDVLYILKEGGVLTTLDPATGKVIKQARLDGALGEYFASPVAADNKIFTLSHEGKLTVIKPGGNWEILATNDMAEECWATPAVSDRCLYVRTARSLYCFSTNKELKVARKEAVGKALP